MTSPGRECGLLAVTAWAEQFDPSGAAAAGCPHCVTRTAGDAPRSRDAGSADMARVESLYYSVLVSSDYIDWERYKRHLTRHTILASNGSARVKPSGSAQAGTMVKIVFHERRDESLSVKSRSGRVPGTRIQQQTIMIDHDLVEPVTTLLSRRQGA
jgi:hypothetical protein